MLCAVMAGMCPSPFGTCGQQRDCVAVQCMLLIGRTFDVIHKSDLHTKVARRAFLAIRQAGVCNVVKVSVPKMLQGTP